MPSTVYPMGTTIYNPEKCWNGFTVFQSNPFGGANAAALLINMNGNIVNMWKGLDGDPSRILPGGYIMGNTGARDPKYSPMGMQDLIQVDWDGNIVWKFNRYELIEDPGLKPTWMVQQHHDWQREGNPVGYYVPGMDPLVDRGNTLILVHKDVRNPLISEKLLVDDAIIEVTWEGKIAWEWVCSDHFDEMDFSEEAKNTLARNPNLHKTQKGEKGDWMHMNCISTLGPNRWYDAGDERFHPDNIIWDGRQTNIIAIISKKTGKIVWKVGPDYFKTPELRRLGQIIGQHHAHMIPRGLPGEGNILVFDNGGWAGFGSPNPGSPNGVDNALRDYSRVLEFDPITLEIKWQYTPAEAGFRIPMFAFMFYSGFISSAQRLPNGNTLITEGAYGRIFEVTPNHEIVWEFINPFRGWSNKLRKTVTTSETSSFAARTINYVYRAYRLPYKWVPQASKPKEKAILRFDNSKFRVLGTLRCKAEKTTCLKSKAKVTSSEQYCIVPKDVREKCEETAT